MRRSVMSAVATVALLTAWWQGPARAGNGAPSLVLSGAPYELAEADDGSHTLALDVTNLSNDRITVTLTVSDAPTGCDPTAEPEHVEARRSQGVTFTLPAACGIGDDPLDMAVNTAGAPAGDALLITANVPEEEPTSYGPLWWYAGAAAFAFLLITIVYLTWSEADRKGRRAMTPLPGIEEKWTFKDSWASNLGLAATVFTGVLGASTLLEKILGKDDSAVVLALVSAAITAGLIGAAPLLLTIFQAGGDAPDSKANTVLGVLVGSAVVVAANIGQICVMAAVLHDADTLDFATVTALAGAAVTVLTVFTIRSLHLTLTKGVTKAPDRPSDAVVAAELMRQGLFVVARGRHLSPDQLDAEIGRCLAAYPGASVATTVIATVTDPNSANLPREVLAGRVIDALGGDDLPDRDAVAGALLDVASTAPADESPARLGQDFILALSSLPMAATSAGDEALPAASAML